MEGVSFHRAHMDNDLNKAVRLKRKGEFANEHSEDTRSQYICFQCVGEVMHGDAAYWDHEEKPGAPRQAFQNKARGSKLVTHGATGKARQTRALRRLEEIAQKQQRVRTKTSGHIPSCWSTSRTSIV